MKRQGLEKKAGKKRWMAVLLCVLAFTAAVPAAPAYAGTKRSTVQSRNRSSSSNEKKMRDAAREVQRVFDEKDLDGLVSMCAYPLTFVDQNGNSRQIESKKDLRAIGKDAIFTKETQDIVGAVNSAKTKPQNNTTLKLGEEAGVTLKKTKNKWKVAEIRVKSSVPEGSGNLVQAAEQFQRTFYYRDLEALSKYCTYPVRIYMNNGVIMDIPSADKLMELGEDKLFTDDMVAQANEMDAATLKEINQKVLVGGTAGFWMVKKNGEWKIDMILQ